MAPINSNLNDKAKSQQNDQMGKMNNIGQTQNFPSFTLQHPLMPSLSYQQQQQYQMLPNYTNPMSNPSNSINQPQMFPAYPNPMLNPSNSTTQPQMLPNYPNPMSNPNDTTTQPKLEKCGWVVGNISFQGGINTSELHVNLRNNITVGKVNKLLTKTTLDTFKFIEELLVDYPSKKVVQDGGQMKKEIQESETMHKKEIEDLKKECEKMKVKCSNWEYKYGMLLRQINKMKKNESGKNKEEEKSKDKAILDVVDVVEDEDPEIINDFDLLQDDKIEEEESSTCSTCSTCSSKIMGKKV
ncbi:unnamed protein product [Meloidogyne enterolobii]|uniref:Uncharacterized protein n=1 Tax=Meloidogyne enterolobii TaxID=390850 RepID=A0ACB0YPZ9_MELEN